MRIRTLVPVLMLVAAACGGAATTPQAVSTDPAAGATPTSQPSAAPSTAAPTEAPDTTAGPDSTAVPQAEGPRAPDFTTTLSDGTAFNLAANGGPVYMIFWAEW